MRMAAAVALGILIIQLLLAAAFLIGLYWLETWQWGLLFSGILLLLLSIPWLGELKIVFDSDGPKGALRVGWWGRASFHRVGDEIQAIFRVLGIPFRRTMDSKANSEVDGAEDEGRAGIEEEPEAPEPDDRDEKLEPRRPPTRRKSLWQLIDVETIEAFCRAMTSGLSAGNELIWDAREFRLWLSAPIQSEMVDTVLERTFGSRGVGPLHVIVTGDGEQRRVRVRYRIGLLRGALAALQLIMNGRAIQFARMMKTKSAQQTPADTDQDLIDEIVEQQKGEAQ